MIRIFVILSIFVFAKCAGVGQDSHELFFSDFERGYRSLSIPRITLSYADNLRRIGISEEISSQNEFFLRFRRRLDSVDYQSLTPSRRVDFDLVKYEIKLNLGRLQLERSFLGKKLKEIPEDNLYSIPNGKDWYSYFLKRWVDEEIMPESIYDFGMSEIARVKEKIYELQKKSGMDEKAFGEFISKQEFFITDSSNVQKAFEQTKTRIGSNLEKFFPHLENISDVAIKRGQNNGMAQVPGFYRNRTFYYNYFEKPFNKRQIEWIYLHEAMPGHHYQAMLAESLPRSKVKRLFNHSAFNEGWAAYVEDIGIEIGAYPDIYSELGKWEWDLIRSVRVPMDVGLNYYGWSDQKALRFWQGHISGKDDIGQREIKRMKRWVAQVVTYKYGAKKFLDLRERQRRRQGKEFSLKAFHRSVLKNGTLPMSILEKHLNTAASTSDQ